MFRLARELGIWDVDSLAENMSAKLFHRWVAFSDLEPFGYQSEWLRFGMLASVVANSNHFRGKDSKPTKPTDFVPKSMDQDFAAKLSAARVAAESINRKSRPGILKGKTTKSLRKLREERRGR